MSSLETVSIQSDHVFDTAFIQRVQAFEQYSLLEDHAMDVAIRLKQQIERIIRVLLATPPASISSERSTCSICICAIGVYVFKKLCQKPDEVTEEFLVDLLELLRQSLALEASADPKGKARVKGGWL